MVICLEWLKIGAQSLKVGRSALAHACSRTYRVACLCSSEVDFANDDSDQ